MTLTHEWEEFLQEQHMIKREIWQKRGLTFDTEFLYIPYHSVDGEVLFKKKRKEPNYTGPNKYLYPTGSHVTLYPSHNLSNSKEWILTEGELDTLTLESYGFSAVTAGGVTSFKREFVSYFKNIRVYICYDNDKRGIDGAEKAAKMFVSAGVEVKIVQLPKEGKVKDIGDFFRVGHTREDFINLCTQAVEFESKDNKLSKSDVVYLEEGQLGDTGSNSVNLLNYEQWKAVVTQNFPKLVFAAEAGLSLFGQLLIKDISNPCALVLIDMPSAGKTIILNLFCGIDIVYSTDKFTPSSFVSQAANVKTEKLKDVDLLPKIRNKVFIIRDLAPLFGQRDDDLLGNMGILTRVLDGEGLELDAGVHGKRGYTGDYIFMMLAASTPIPPKVFKLMGNLGSRLFFLGLRSESKSEDVLADQLVKTPWKQKQAICREATHGFLKYLWEKYPDGVEWDNKKDSEEHRRIVSRCALLLSRLRGSINIWKEDFRDEEFAYQEPIIEMPDRIAQVLYNIARGHALISGRTNIDTNDLIFILNITLDSAQLARSRLFRLLIDNGGELTTDILVTKLNCSKPTALKEMEILKILGLVNLRDSEYSTVGRPEKVMSLKEELSWFISDECSNLREQAEKFKTEEVESNQEDDLYNKAKEIFGATSVPEMSKESK